MRLTMDDYPTFLKLYGKNIAWAEFTAKLMAQISLNRKSNKIKSRKGLS